MTDGGSSWEPIGRGTSPRMLGIYREPDNTRTRSRNKIKFTLVLVILATVVFLTCLFWLGLRNEKAADGINTTSSTTLVIEAPRQPFNVTESSFSMTAAAEEEAEVQLQEDLIPSEEEDGMETSTRDGARSRGGRMTSDEEMNQTEHQTESVVTRRSRANDEALLYANVPRPRVINRKPMTQHVAGYPQIPSYSDGYPQLEVYRAPVRGVYDVMDWVRPGIKFSGIYIRGSSGSGGDHKIRPFLNGHAYASDPFNRFKPSHPAEINQLAEGASSFSSRPEPSPTTSHTQAIFHSPHPTRPKPLKVMLDIYPMLIDTHTGLVDSEVGPRGHRGHPSPGRMVVHLNLYPKKSSQRLIKKQDSAEMKIQERMFDDMMEPSACSEVDETIPEGMSTPQSLAEGTTQQTTEVVTGSEMVF